MVIQAYKSCTTDKEAEMLLENIEVKKCGLSYSLY